MTEPAPLPPETAALAERHRLGPLRASYALRRYDRQDIIAYSLVVLLGLAVFVLPGLVLIWMATRSPNLSRKQAAKRLCLFEEGLIAPATFGGRVVVARWGSLTLHQAVTRHMVSQDVSMGTTYRYSLRTRAGARAEITEAYEGAGIWGSWIPDAITRAQAPAVLDAVRDGRRVTFGRFTVCARGVTTARKGLLPWRQVGEIRVSAGRMVVRRSGRTRPWASTAVWNVPNCQVFLTVAESLRGR
ncbi:DUF6585 family protein [Streptomyces sp. NPDC079020]|uniref:DUF6585 family protein n=1 Tax=Streptomyces sp. NPDC079020 TaxID=3365722 RepID=UPI0037D71DC6